MSTQNQLLEGYLRREQLASELGKSTRTLDRWDVERTGPPRVRMGGKTILYRVDAVREWLQSREDNRGAQSHRRQAR